MEVTGVVFAGEIEGVDGSGGADEKRLDAEPVVVDRAGGRGEIEDVIDLARVEGF